MVNELQAGVRALIALCVPALLSFSSGSASLELEQATTEPEPVAEAALPAPPPPLPPPLPVTVGEVFLDGTVITISKDSQHMYVLHDGALWDSSPVSTGKRGKETPSGLFAILQKKTFHRSNLYSNAPMPFMQRLTWDGIAIHAGHLPGYPASHGCIRVPRAFAQKLFRQTGFTSTAVIVVDEPLNGPRDAIALAARTNGEIPIELATLEIAAGREPSGATTREEAEKLAAGKVPRVASAMQKLALLATAPPPEPVPAPLVGEAVQLAATTSRAEADAHWQRVVRAKPQLAGMTKQVVRAMVGGTQYYRLRVSASDARATCADLRKSGFDCFEVG